MKWQMALTRARPHRRSPTPHVVGRDSVAFDAGLRSHMLSVYNYMASGVLLTGIVAHAVRPFRHRAADLFTNGGLLKWVVILGPLGLVMWLSFGINRISTGTAQALFWAFAALMGLSLSTIFLHLYRDVDRDRPSSPPPAAFAGLSLWGYTTKKDLSAFGTFLIMGLVGLIIAMMINIFLQSPALDLAISAIGVLIFAGLTAYDTQKIKSMYFAGRRHRIRRQGGRDGRADALSRLHQHVPVPAALHGQPGLVGPRFSADRTGEARRKRRAFSLAPAPAPARVRPVTGNGHCREYRTQCSRCERGDERWISTSSGRPCRRVSRLALADWLFAGVIFHGRYQLHPEIWRPGARSAAASSPLRRLR